MRNKLYALMAMIVGLVGLGAAPAFAVDPTPPVDPTAAATSAIANFGDKALSTFTSLMTNTWVLAIFAFGIALAFARGVIRRVRGKVSRSVA